MKKSEPVKEEQAAEESGLAERKLAESASVECKLTESTLAETDEQIKASGQTKANEPVKGVKSVSGNNLVSEDNCGFPVRDVVLFDLDNLKVINDNFGHEKGDEALKLCYQCISQAFQNVKNCFRIGGDEFVAIYPGTEAEFLILVDSLKDFMKKTCLASFGAKYYPNGVNLKNAISECDKLMYKYKQQYFTKNSITR